MSAHSNAVSLEEKSNFRRKCQCLPKNSNVNNVANVV